MFTDLSPITDSEVEVIHQTLQRMKQVDPEFRVSDAKVSQYNVGPPVPEQDLREFEEKSGLLLPVDYRSFLNRIGPGAGPGCDLDFITAEDQMEMCDVHQPFPFTTAGHFEPDEKGLYPGGRFPGVLLLGYYGGYSFSCLVVTGSARGTVWDQQENSFFPSNKTFGQWYAAWLGFLTEVAAPRIQADAIVDQVKPGMRRSELIALCGRTGGNLRELRPYGGYYALGYDNLLSHFQMEPSASGEEDKIKQIIRSGIGPYPWVFGSQLLSQKTSDTVWGD